MNIPVHHYYDSQTHTYFSSCHNHNKEYKQLTIDTRICIGCLVGKVMHFREGDQQQIGGIQHQFNAHENDDGIAARQYAHHANTKQGDREIDIIFYLHFLKFKP